MNKLVQEINPSAVIVDPVSNLVSIGDPTEVKVLLMRLVDMMKQDYISSIFTSLVTGKDDPEGTEMGVSSLMDSWILVRDIEIQGERNRRLYVIKSRGMSHSNQVRELLLTNHGVEIKDVYVGPAGVLPVLPV